MSCMRQSGLQGNEPEEARRNDVSGPDGQVTARFVVYKNSYSTANLNNGQWCAVDIVTDKDGIGVTKPAGANRTSVAGVCVETIAHQDYGLVQVWGYKADCRCLGGSLSAATKITAGSPLVFGTSGFAAKNRPRTSAALKSKHGARIVGVAIGPLNTAAIATFFATSGMYQVLIKCL
jgi:hypothetical protein